MPGYTSEEVQSSIDKFLMGQVSTPLTSLGARDVLRTREDVYALLTTTLLLKPESYFYVILLAKNRLEALRQQQLVALNFILDSATSAGLQRRGTPVTSTTELTNAQAALLNVNASLNAHTSARALTPELNRFRSSIERFVTRALAPNVVDAGVPTETAGELREKVKVAWAAVVTRHAQMVTLAEAISAALDALGGVRLPERAVQALVSNISTRLTELTTTLADDKSLSTHRESMLELLTMRTLLGRVSLFRTPSLLLAPLTGDSSTVEASGGSSPPRLFGSVSGPFNIPPTSTLDFELGSPVSVVSLSGFRYSNAEVESIALSYPLTFAAGASLQIRVDGVLYPAQSYSLGSYVSSVLFVASLNSYFSANSIPALAYASGGRVLLRSNTHLDVSSIEVLMGTPGELAFQQVVGFRRYATATPVSAREVMLTCAVTSEVRFVEARTEYWSGQGTTLGGSTLDASLATGTVDTAAGGTSFLASVNLEARGVRKGMTISIGGVPNQLMSVVGGVFTVLQPLTAGGVEAFVVGVDFSEVPTGARVHVSSTQVPLNSGYYRLIGGDVGEVTVDRPFFATGDSVSVLVESSYLDVETAGVSIADGVAAWPASSVATALGYPASATQTRVLVTKLQSSVDFAVRGVTPGDVVVVGGSTTTAEQASGTTLNVAGLPFFAGAAAYTVKSYRYVRWESLAAAASAFAASVSLKAADFAITRIVSGAAPVALLATGGPVDKYLTTLTNLGAISNYDVPAERSIDNIIKMLAEQGFDRAADLLTTLRITEFFEMHPDGVSYATHAERTIADVTRLVAPISRLSKSFLGHPEVRLLSRSRLR